LALPEVIQKITMKEGAFCKQCDTALMDIEFNKVENQIKSNKISIDMFRKKILI